MMSSEVKDNEKRETGGLSLWFPARRRQKVIMRENITKHEDHVFHGYRRRQNKNDTDSHTYHARHGVSHVFEVGVGRRRIASISSRRTGCR